MPGAGGELGLEMGLGARAAGFSVGLRSAGSHLLQGPSLRGGEEFMQIGNKKHILPQWKKKEERIIFFFFGHLHPLGHLS